MSKAYSSLENIKLCQLPLPGSHDAGAYGDIAVRSKAQELNITRQLNAGFRYFDFRVCVDNGVFYAVHGDDPTSNNYAAVASRRQDVGKNFIFEDIRKFCEAHKQELVILHFSHFVGKGGQDFNAKDDQPDFADLIREYFRDMLVAPQSSIPAYGACVTDGKQIVAIVDSDDTWNQRQGQMDLLWSTRSCFLDRYSNKYFDMSGGAAVDNLQAKIDYTLEDQEDGLLLGGSGHRNPNKFWVTQAVLNYAAVPHNGKSQNYYGARLMNPQFRDAYKNWYHGKDRKGVPNQHLQKPNVLLMDYAGYFLGEHANDPLHLF